MQHSLARTQRYHLQDPSTPYITLAFRCIQMAISTPMGSSAASPPWKLMIRDIEQEEHSGILLTSRRESKPGWLVRGIGNRESAINR